MISKWREKRDGYEPKRAQNFIILEREGEREGKEKKGEFRDNFGLQ